MFLDFCRYQIAGNSTRSNLFLASVALAAAAIAFAGCSEKKAEPEPLKGPVLSQAAISVDPAPPNALVLLSVNVQPRNGTIASVNVNLSSAGGTGALTLKDDGTGGDATAADGVYSAFWNVPGSTTAGAKSAVFTATDSLGDSATANLSFQVSANAAPAISNALATPASQAQTLSVLFTANVSDSDGLSFVRLDLSALNGSAQQAMYDDGTNGDLTASDGKYSYSYTLPSGCPTGSFQITLTAADAGSVTNFANIAFTARANSPPTFANPQANPTPCPRNAMVLMTIRVSDDVSVASALIDLSSIGGSASTALNDNGINGDVASGDGVYSLRQYIQTSATPGVHSFGVIATDGDGFTNTTAIPLTISSAIAPTISNASATPHPQEVGFPVLCKADVTDDGTITMVVIDLSSIGGSPAPQQMYDDGTNGDVTAGDGTYSFQHLVPLNATPGSYTLLIVAYDNSSTGASTTIALTLTANQAPSITGAGFAPLIASSSQRVVLTATVTDKTGIASVTANLTTMGGSAAAALLDNGVAPDSVAGDDVYTLEIYLPADPMPGNRNVLVTATDAAFLFSTYAVSMTVARFRLEHSCFLEDIHGTSTTDIYTVGQYSQVIHWDGTRWRLMDPAPGVSDQWYSVWCESASSVWIGGLATRAMHYDGTSWTTRNVPASGYIVKAIWADGAGKVWFVGGLLYNAESATAIPPRNDHDADDGYFIVSWDNATSSYGTPITTSNDDDLNDIFGVAANDIVAVGDDGRIMHWNGSTWLNESVTTVDDFYGVWGYNDGTQSHYWAVSGRNSGPATANIYKYNPSTATWSSTGITMPTTALNLSGIYGAKSGNSLSVLYATGTYDNTPQYGTAWRSNDGNGFSQITVSVVPPGNSSNYFPYAPYRLIMTDTWIPPGTTELWMTGHRSIQYYNQTATPPWKEYTRSTYESTKAIHVYSPTRVLTWDFPGRGPTNQGSSIVHDYNNGAWYEYNDNTGTISTGLTDYPMLNYPGTTALSRVPRMYAIRMFNLNSVYGVGDDGHVYWWNGTRAIGSNFNSQHMYGTSSTDQRRLYALWGTSATDFWYGGEDSRIYHFTSASNWTSAVPTESILPGPTRDVTCIFGTGNSNIYAVGADSAFGTRVANNGIIWHYDGISWTDVTGTNGLPAAGSLANLNHVWGTTSGMTYIVGDGGLARYWDGSIWNNLNSALGSPSTPIQTVFGDSGTGDVIMAGNGTRVWVKSGSTWSLIRTNGGTVNFYGGDMSGSMIMLTGSAGLTVRLEK